MEESIKKLIYLSGPPCAGKSTICNELINKNSNIKYIPGDAFWVKNDNCDFISRVLKTNKDIIEAIRLNTSDLSLLEWVPCNGLFVSDLKDICKEKNIDFSHVVIFAPEDILKIRKYERDKNKDLGPINIEEIKKLDEVLLLDSSIMSIESMVQDCEKLFNY